MKNITDLNNELCNLFAALRDGKADPDMAKQMNNTAANIVNVQKVKLQYNAQTGQRPKKIEFLED